MSIVTGIECVKCGKKDAREFKKEVLGMIVVVYVCPDCAFMNMPAGMSIEKTD